MHCKILRDGIVHKKRNRGGRKHKEDRGWDKVQRVLGVGESTKRTSGGREDERIRGGRDHKDD